MELALKTIVDSQQFINNELNRVEYQGLKMRLYDVVDYLLKFKTADEYQRRLEMANNINIGKADPHAKALADFYNFYN
ncbi:hypothetical protein DF186_20685, partial [Enterococcus hirae]